MLIRMNRLGACAAILIAGIWAASCGSSSDSVTKGSGGGASSSSTAVTSASTGAPFVCASASDCQEPANECQVATCTANVCGVGNAPKDQNVVDQISGTCMRTVCDGMGGKLKVNDDGNVPLVATACETAVCTAGVPSTPPTPAETKYADGAGGTVCDGAGKCVACVIDADCKDKTNVCVANACVAASCMDRNRMAPRPTSIAAAARVPLRRHARLQSPRGLRGRRVHEQHLQGGDVQRRRQEWHRDRGRLRRLLPGLRRWRRRSRLGGRRLHPDQRARAAFGGARRARFFGESAPWRSRSTKRWRNGSSTLVDRRRGGGATCFEDVEHQHHPRRRRELASHDRVLEDRARDGFVRSRSDRAMAMSSESGLRRPSRERGSALEGPEHGRHQRASSSKSPRNDPVSTR